MVPAEPLAPPLQRAPPHRPVAGREGLLQRAASPTGCACVPYTHAHARRSSVYALSQKSTFSLFIKKTDSVCFVFSGAVGTSPPAASHTKASAAPRPCCREPSHARPSSHPPRGRWSLWSDARAPARARLRPCSAGQRVAAQTEHVAGAELRLLPARPVPTGDGDTQLASLQPRRQRALPSPCRPQVHLQEWPGRSERLPRRSSCLSRLLIPLTRACQLPPRPTAA